MRMLDLFCGRWGWSRAFAARGWDCVGVDLVKPPEMPEGCHFFKLDILEQDWYTLSTIHNFDFICASPPCEQFSVHGMKHFHLNPKYPENGIKLFNHTRELCEASGVPYVIENVRAAQQFVGNAVHHCGPFYLWGNGVPTLIPRDIWKHVSFSRGDARYHNRPKAAERATIPPELANCVADYAEALIRQRNEQERNLCLR